MHLRPKHAWFLAFTAVFAVLAGFVFWGTWSLDACPVMPDSPMAILPGWEWFGMGFVRRWIATGCVTPFDLIRSFLFTPYFWQELLYVGGVFFAGLGLAYYLRGRGLSSAASYCAGLFLSFSGYWLTLFSAGHGTWFLTMSYCIFVFGLADRAVRKNKLKNWLLLGACAAWGSFYQTDLWLLFTVFAGVYFVWCCVRERKLPDWKGILLAAVVFFAIGAPSFIRAISSDLAGRDRQIEESKGSALAGGEDGKDARWIFVTNWSLPPKESLEFFIPRLNGDTSCPMTLALGRRQGTGVRQYTGALGRPFGATQGNYRQHSLYVGWVTCLLALAGVVMAFFAKSKTGDTKDRREVIFFVVSAVVFWLFSLGRYCEPVYRIVYALPFGDYLRAPVKWHHLTEFCLCVLAGHGIAAVLAVLCARGMGVRLAYGIACIVVLFGACDLARIDRLYCAVVDLRLAKGPNAAAEEILRRGGGKTLDLMEGGNGFVSWAFTTKRVGLTGDLADPDVRFAWGGSQLSSDKRAGAWLKSRKAVLVGTYVVSPKGIYSVPSQAANAFLFEIPGAPAKMPKLPETPPITYVTWLGALSLLSTLGVLGYGLKKA